MKKISVVIPTYNHSSYVLESIESVLRSDGVEPEIIVINDGSTDRTRDLISSNRDINYFEQANQGAHAAINFGLSQARHPIVAILNDDDLYDRNHLINGILQIQANNLDIFIGRAQVFGEGKLFGWMNEHIKICDERILEYGLFESLTQLNFAVSTSSMIMKKEVFSQGKGFLGLTMCHDFEFLFSSIINLGSTIYFEKFPTWKYRAHKDNSSSTISSDMSSAQWYFALLSNLLNGPRDLFLKVKEYGDLIGLNEQTFEDLIKLVRESPKNDSPETCVLAISAYMEGKN